MEIKDWMQTITQEVSSGIIAMCTLIMGYMANHMSHQNLISVGVIGIIAGVFSTVVNKYNSTAMARAIEAHDNEVAAAGATTKPHPLLMALVAGGSSIVGNGIPLLAAYLISDYWTRLIAIMVIGAASLIVVGWLGSYTGEVPSMRAPRRHLFGGCLAIVFSFLLSKWLGN